jgi:uncharacterized protein (TIGR02147 family)
VSKQTFESLFNMTDFRTYVQSWVKSQGRGEFRKIAMALGIHTTLVSQIFSGKKCLTEEQATMLCDYMGLNALETDYFLKLVQLERAGSEPLRILFRRHLKLLQVQSSEVKSRVPEAEVLSEQDRAVFYSSWQYSVVRLLTSIPEFRTKEKIAARLGLSISRVQEILDFLTSRHLCKESRGQYQRTEKNTHIEASSALAIRHHQNWRAKSLELQEQMTKEDLAFTAPISISKEDTEKVRKILLNTISDIAKIVEASPAEEVVYLGIDWMGI